MSDDLAASLFGIGDPNVVLSPVDQNNPIAPARYGWYCQIANGAVTTPFDAFMNWGAGAPSYSQQILVAQLPNKGQSYPCAWLEFRAQYAAAAAADMPPSAIVTLAPSVLDLSAVAIGATNTLPAVLTNNQKDPLQNIAVASSYPDVFSVSGAPTELQPGETATINVAFSPNAVGQQSGKITVSAKGQYGPICLLSRFPVRASHLNVLLFVAKSDQRIHLRCAPRRNVAGE